MNPLDLILFAVVSILPASSSSKDESLERGMYVGDVKLLPSSCSICDSLEIEIESAWIERSWRSGYWYWTTIADSYGYSIKIITSLNSSQKNELVIRNNISSDKGFEGLAYYKDRFSGYINSLPQSNTLRYTILKKNNIDLSEKNIRGYIEFMIER